MEKEKRRKMEQDQSFDEHEDSSSYNEKVSQELHQVNFTLYFYF